MSGQIAANFLVMALKGCMGAEFGDSARPRLTYVAGAESADGWRTAKPLSAKPPHFVLCYFEQRAFVLTQDRFRDANTAALRYLN
jgi:hypothetical protein